MKLDIRKLAKSLGGEYDGPWISELETEEFEEVDVRKLVRGISRSSHSARPDRTIVSRPGAYLLKPPTTLPYSSGRLLSRKYTSLIDS